MSFAIPGTLILLLTIWMAFHPDLKSFSESLSAVQADARSKALLTAAQSGRRFRSKPNKLDDPAVKRERKVI